MKNRSIFFPTLLVVFAIMIASGACSQHTPGSFQGGGREIPTSEIDNTSGPEPPPPDASVQDNFVAPDVKQDTGQLFDSGNQG